MDLTPSEGAVNEKNTRIIRWIARIWAVLIAAIIAVIFIGHAIEDGIGPAPDLSLRDSLMMVAFFITWIGLVLGWKWERLAGYLILGGMTAFYLLNFAGSQNFHDFLISKKPSMGIGPQLIRVGDDCLVL